MKKKDSYVTGNSLTDYWFQFFRTMKIFISLMLLTVSGICANSYSQNTKFTLNLNQVTVKEVFDQIQDQSEFVIFYKDSQVDLNRKVNVVVEDSQVNQILDETFAGTNLSYKIYDRQIVITLKEIEKEIENKIDRPKTEEQQKKTITGKVTDSNGEPLPGVSIVVKGTTQGTTTNVEGEYFLGNVPENAVLQFSFIGMKSEEVVVGKGSVINMTLGQETEGIEEVTVVAFGKQRQQEIVSSVSTIRTEDLAKSSGNLTSVLAGRMPGMISFQTSGEPGKDDANYFIRGITTFGTNIYPLVIVDQVEMDRSDLGKLSPDDIESFSILKDASATALYGTKGANGVILITTKTGKTGKVNIKGRVETRFAVPTSIPDFADGVSYMKKYNQTMMSQYPDKTPEELALFSDSKIINTEKGTNKFVYPNVDWYSEMFKNFSQSTMASLNMSGGGSVVNYYVSANYENQGGMLKKVNIFDNFNTEIDIKRYNIRSNIGIKVTPTTNVAINFSGTFEDYQGPRQNADLIFSQITTTSPSLFPMYYEADAVNQGLDGRRIFYGNLNDGSGTGASYNNPYETMTSQVQDKFNTTMIGTLRLNQDLDNVLNGLKASAVASFRTTTRYEGWRGFTPYFYTVDGYNEVDDQYVLSLPLDEGSDYLNLGGTVRLSEYFTYFEGSLNYSASAGRSDFKALLLTKYNENGVSEGDAFTSLPQRNMGVIGRFNYLFDKRYALEFNFGYYGSEKFTPKNRYGFFPSIGGAWNISEEGFFESAKRTVTQLKLRGSYGSVGNDKVSDKRFVYLSSIATGQEYQYFFGATPTAFPGAIVNQYANPDLGWEIAKKLNLGFDLELFNDFTLNVDVYKNKREGIYMTRSNIPASSGLPSQGGNIGKAESKGIDVGWRYNKFFGNDFWVQSWGTFTYAKGIITEREEKNYEEDYRKQKGLPINQVWGYVADRLFIDDADASNSPVQQIGGANTYTGGDLKYRDVNGDYVVNEKDIVPLGFPSTPEINYGFGVSVGYKGFDFSCFFQGLENRSFFINAGFDQEGNGYENGGFKQEDLGIIPFVNKRNLLTVIENDHWSPNNPNSQAFWPRLTINKIDNNAVQSTWWLKDGGFMRLKNAEIGYTLPTRLTDRLKINKTRLYVRGSNLALIYSKFDLWDPEQGGNGFGYPLQKTFNIGMNISF